MNAVGAEYQRVGGTASRTRSLALVASSAACSLKGTVTLQPLPPRAAKSRTKSAKPSSGTRARS
jgi:predicted small lipoprotein YifL